MLEEISKYIVIWLAIAALAAGLLYTAIRLIIEIVRSRRTGTAPMSWDECRAYAEKIKKQYPDPKPEQVAERPHVELHEDEVNRVFEWDD